MQKHKPYNNYSPLRPLDFSRLHISTVLLVSAFLVITLLLNLDMIRSEVKYLNSQRRPRRLCLASERTVLVFLSQLLPVLEKSESLIMLARRLWPRSHQLVHLLEQKAHPDQRNHAAPQSAALRITGSLPEALCVSASPSQVRSLRHRNRDRVRQILCVRTRF